MADPLDAVELLPQEALVVLCPRHRDLHEVIVLACHQMSLDDLRNTRETFPELLQGLLVMAVQRDLHEYDVRQPQGGMIEQRDVACDQPGALQPLYPRPAG